MRVVACKCVAVIGVLAALAAFAVNGARAQEDPPARKPKPAPAVNLSEASITVKLGDAAADGLKFPLAHTGKNGWYARAAGSNPRTPAVDGETLVVGGGNGSELHGYDVETGKRKWTAANNDEGISSIVAQDGYAYYTTHSCTIEKIRITDGHKEYSIRIAPTVECAPDVYGPEVATAAHESGSWRVAVRETKGAHIKWDTPVGQQGVVSQPTIIGGNVYITTIDGRLTRLGGATGFPEWVADAGAVSAPVRTPWGLVITTTWDGDESRLRRQTPEQRKKRARETKAAPDAGESTLIAREDRQVAIIENPEVEPNVLAGDQPRGPHTSLDYQGLRPGVTERHIIFAYKGQVTAVEPIAGKPSWTLNITDERCEFVRPVAHKGLVFVATNTGMVTAIEESAGAIVWSYKLEGCYFVAEPAIDNNNLLLTTLDGLVVCIPTAGGTVSAGAPTRDAKDPEGTAAAYWKVQKQFRNARMGGGELVAEQPQPQASGDSPGRSNAGTSASGQEAILPKEDEKPAQGK
jgi:outer membrane protein assembly factor BamB